MRPTALLPYAAAIAALIPFAALTAQTGSPAPRTVPLTETVHGITLEDEYRWMEDPATKAEWSGWVAAESQRTAAFLNALPYRAEFAQSIRSVSSSLIRQSGYQRAAGTEIWRRAKPGDPSPKLMVRTAKGTRVLVDPAKVGGNELAAMGEVTLSPDGTTVAVHLSSGGSEVGSTRFFDAASGKEVGQPVPMMWGEFGIVFLPGGRIGYTQLSDNPPGGDITQGMRALVRPLAGGTAQEVLGGKTGGADLAESEFPILLDSPASPFVLGVGGGARADQRAYVTTVAALNAGKPMWHKAFDLDDRIGSAALRGSQLYQVSAKTSSSREVQVRPLDAQGRPGPVSTLFKGNDRLIVTEVLTAQDGVYILATTDGAGRLFYTPGGKAAVREVKLPFEGSIFGHRPAANGAGIVLALTGWTTNATSLVVQNGTVRETGIAAQSWAGATDFTSERLEATSADGTKVPMVVVRRKGANAPAPTLLESYGGYGADSANPVYNRNGMAWLAKGGVLAHCGVRGGGERGRAWHEGGRGPNKPRGMEDLIACAELLSAKGIAPARGPVSIGGSMGGALIPTAALRKPSAFGGMITLVGVVNASRIGNADNGANQFGEMGDPAIPAQFKDLVAMDAYQMLPKAGGLPPTMMVIGMNDRRVAPWMTAKFTARARRLWPEAPIFLRGDPKSGHGVGTTEDVRTAEVADTYAFAWWVQTR